jgi:hypothetical protein
MKFKYFFVYLMFTGFVYGSDTASLASSVKSASCSIPKDTLEYIAVLYTTGQIPKNNRSYGDARLQKMVNFLYMHHILQHEVLQILNDPAGRGLSMHQWKLWIKSADQWKSRFSDVSVEAYINFFLSKNQQKK